MALTGQQWNTVYRLASELVVLHQTSANEVEKVARAIRSGRLGPEEASAWLDARVRYATYFSRSRRSVAHIWTIKALVELLVHDAQGDMRRVAEMLGWVARLMRYYQHQSLDRRQIERNRLLHVPEIPRGPAPQKRRPRRTAPEIPAPREPSQEALDLWEQLRRHWEEQDDE